MNPDFLRVCTQDLRLLADAIGQGRVGTADGLAIFTEPDNFARWQKLIDRIFKVSPWHDHIDRVEVMFGVDAILRELVQQPATDVDARMQTWRQAVLTMDGRLELLPVQGITAFERPFILGKVKFWHLTERRIEGLVRFTVKEGGAPRDLISGLRQHLTEDLKGLKDTTVAIYQARGSARRTRQDALTEVRRVLPVLRALTMLSHGNPMKVDIAVAGDAKSILHDGFTLTRRGGGFGRHFEGGHLAPMYEDLPINRMHLPVYRSLGLSTVQSALTDPPPSDSWAGTLALAYQWIGTAQQSVSPEAAILSLAVALEVLFSTSHQGLTQTIADGVAFLTRTGRDARLKRVDEVGTLYAVRSQITHGTPTKVTWEQVDEMRTLLYEVLVAAVAESDSWVKKADFQAHLKRLKYGL